jgi:hypothetical protein
VKIPGSDFTPITPKTHATSGMTSNTDNAPPTAHA